jgi:Leucine-rich repeat (LRR) protein
LEELFSNLQELTLNQNSSLENLDGLPLFLKLKILTMREADSLSAMPKAICSLLTLTKLDLKDCLFS